jgi:UDP-3-O-[3-hydroxymyristoyl] glucosamine N-acyltransferase
MRVTLAELACLLAGELEGDGQTTICGIAPLDQAQAGDITFLTESKHVARLATSHATAVLVAPAIPVDRPAIRVADPYLGFIHLLEHFFSTAVSLVGD